MRGLTTMEPVEREVFVLGSRLASRLRMDEDAGDVPARLIRALDAAGGLFRSRGVDPSLANLLLDLVPALRGVGLSSALDPLDAALDRAIAAENPLDTRGDHDLVNALGSSDRVPLDVLAPLRIRLRSYHARGAFARFTALLEPALEALPLSDEANDLLLDAEDDAISDA